MKKQIQSLMLALVMVFTVIITPANTLMETGINADGNAPSFTDFIVTDQFGYLPDGQKTAVIRNPKKGVDAGLSFSPGSEYRVIAENGQTVYQGTPVHKFSEDAASGDEIWWFDFSEVVTPGRYYVLDVQNNVRSFGFEIAEDVYNEVLKHAVRMFYYQRAGFAKDAKYAGEGWADGASHLQDSQARYFYDQNNADTTRDVSGGWYDAGDYNKYTAWTARYVEDLLECYRENPEVFGDNYNIPESGNGIPDIIDEAKWGLEHLLKLQNDSSYAPTVLPPNYHVVSDYDGSVLSVIGMSNKNENGGHASPPSTAAGVTLYGPPSATATYAAARAFALGAVIFEEIDSAYSEKLKTAATKAYNWADNNPNVMFQNNNSTYNSIGLAAGGQEIESDSTGARTENRIKAALYMYEMTGDKSYLFEFDDNYQKLPLYQWWGQMDHYRTSQHLMYFQYINAVDATPSVVDALKNGNRGMIAAFNKADSWYAAKIGHDGYRSALSDYPWGSNRAKSEMGLTFWFWQEYNMEPAKTTDFKEAAADYIHYIHGVNPFNMVYLTNMNDYGASKSLTSIYHDWFYPKTKWDKAGVSDYGPAPGYLSGGANNGFNVDKGYDGHVQWLNSQERELGTYIKDNMPSAPPAKTYMDINNGWPFNSWEITEPSCGYQTNYIRLLSKFAAPETIVTPPPPPPPPPPPFILGRIISIDEETSIFDALEILKALVGMSSLATDNPAALITADSQEKGEPSIFDALEILKFLVGMDSRVDGIHIHGTPAISDALEVLK